MAMREINENDSMTLTLTFRDRDRQLVIPTAATYGIIDLDSGDALVPLGTEIDDLASEVDLEITSNENRILDDSKPSERRRVTVEFDYGASKHKTEEYDYVVKNLQCVPMP
jgi:predicted nucleotidyltransferase